MTLIWLLVLILIVGIAVTLVNRSGLDATFKSIFFYVAVGGVALYIILWLYHLSNGGVFRVY